MTRRKVHHWLHTGLLGEPVRREARGHPTLLSFEQLLKVAVLQRLRDDLGFSLQRVRNALAWLLEQLTDEEWSELHFYRTGAGDIGVRDQRGNTFAIGGQGVMEDALPDALTKYVADVRQQWETGVVPIRGFKSIVSNVAVMAGAPVLIGTRVETAFVAHVARDAKFDDVASMFRHVPRTALREALAFEGIAA
jgi:uncharacterized protein (DUF433 family)